jgi:release factor glutamine methyltransferase
MRIERIRTYEKMAPEELKRPASQHVFFDPPDTELGAWVGADLLSPGCVILDLGSGGGATAGALARSGARHVHGVDSSEESILYCRRVYGQAPIAAQLSFQLGDFLNADTPSLLAGCGLPAVPTVVCSNPAYVPLTPSKSEEVRSIDGGPDGLKFVPSVLRHAVWLGAKLALTIGSYSSPRQACRLLAEAGYGIRRITLCALSLGNFTRKNPDRILQLEADGEAVLWRPGGDVALGYLIVGFACHRTQDGDPSEPVPTAHQIFALLQQAGRSPSAELEGLDDLAPWAIPCAVRVLVLPELERWHW